MKLHVVSFDVPYPPNYGGVMDVYYKIKALSESGVKVHLHAFDYGRGHQPELALVCAQVSYYKRSWLYSLAAPFMPYIISSRRNPKLLQALAADADAILFEGLHTCGYLTHPDLRHKARFVRTHNLEHQYYQGLGAVEKSRFKRMYFLWEAARLAAFEPRLGAATGILAISRTDQEHLARYCTAKWLPPFHGNARVTSVVETVVPSDAYALYHGNLTVGENHEAALFLVNEVFNEPIAPLVIVGNKPGEELLRAVSDKAWIKLIDTSDPQVIDAFIHEAHIHVLPTFQPTGVKLKLLNALFKGRHVLVNRHMIAGTGLDALLAPCEDAIAFKKEVLNRMLQPFSSEEVALRNHVLSDSFSEQKWAKQLISLIWG